MDAEALSAAMGRTLPIARYEALLPTFNAALIQAGCTTVRRAAMWCAQVGHESVGLRYMEEIASGAAYEGRHDLGNIYPGDGMRFKGRGPIQVTGRANYAACSRWAYGRGYVPTPTYFVDNPPELASDRYGFLGAVWYWTVGRTQLNTLSDAGDVVGATKAINGGTNGLADREARWTECLRLGAALLPSDPAPVSKVEPMIQNFPVTGSGALELNVPLRGASALYGAAWISARTTVAGGTVDVWWGLSGVGGRGEAHWHNMAANTRYGTPNGLDGGDVDQATVHYFFGEGVPGVITLECQPK